MPGVRAMIFVRPLTDDERRVLQRLARSEVGRVSERMHMVLLAGRRYPVPQIAAIFDCDEATVRTWLGRFEAEGVDGLRDRPRSGRPRTADAGAREEIGHALDQAPSACGYLAGYWTVAMLAAHLATRHGVCLSRTTVRRVLRGLDARWRRPRHELRHDPDARAKMAHLAARILAAPAAAVLAMDECDVHLLPVLRAMWMRRGRQARIPTPGGNRKRAVFGALDLESGVWHYAVTPRKRAIEFVAFLDQVAAAYPDRPVLLALDNASIHTATAVTAWLADHPAVEVLHLPAYSGHEQNPVEKVWWRLKDKVAANRLHGSLDELVAAVHAFFASFTPEDALRLAA
jgi:transposase